MIDEPIDAYFRTADFAIEATYKGATITGIFDKSFIDVVGVEAETPTFTTATAWVPDARNGDFIQISGARYTVIRPEPDGTGVTVLFLNEA